MRQPVSLVLLGLVVLLAAAAAVPLPARAAFVNCGKTDAQGQLPPAAQCSFRDLVGTIVLVLNYLISMAAAVAIYFVLLGGFNLVTALGNAEKIEKAKNTISEAVVGFAIILLAFMFVNLLVNGLFGKSGSERKWWDVNCIYDPTGSGCPYATAYNNARSLTLGGGASVIFYNQGVFT